MATARAEAENAYGAKLLEISQSSGPRTASGFNYDEGATVRKAYEGIVTEMGEEGKHHIQVSENIRVLVLTPFRRWTDSHRARVEYSSEFLRTKVKVYEREGQDVQKIQRKYFNKCRLLDEARESDEVMAESVKGLAIKEETDQETVPLDSPGLEAQVPSAPDPPAPEEFLEEEDEPVELADTIYSAQHIKILLSQMLEEIPQKEVKVPIMGTYDHVSVGSDIVSWLLANVTSGSMAIAEAFGQDLVSNGFLRLVGQVGNKFANSSVLNYQWKKQAFQMAGLTKPVAQRENTFSPFVGEYLSGTINNYLNNPHIDETPVQKLTREVTELDAKYKDTVVRFDDARCALEESIFEHLAFMERCESDRLNAIKHVFLDFVASLSNVVPSIQASVDKYLLYQETVVIERDLLYLVESYKTGGFAPRVAVYDNYYSPAEGWTFGIDLELRCRGDGKRLPQIISTSLRHLDDEYPVLENDEVRLSVWTGDVPLKKAHELRKELNNGKPVNIETLAKYPAPVVASMLKLYLRELPDSVVPSMFYDSIKMIYADHGNDENPGIRIRQVQATFGQMRLSQIAVLDALFKHLERLMYIAKPGQSYRDKLATELAPCLLRPRQQTSLTLSDRHPQRLVHDLLEHRRAILSELKRHNSGGPASRASSMRSMSGSTVGSRQASTSISGSVPDFASLDTALYRAPLARNQGLSRLDPGALKLRGPREPAGGTNGGGSGNMGSVSVMTNNVPGARHGVELTDGPAPPSASVSPEPQVDRSDPYPYSSVVSPVSPGGARHGQVLTNVVTTSEGAGVNDGDGDDSDDEPAITRIQATPTIP